MIVVGLTGGIAMGKSAVTRVLATKGIPVFDTDSEVHILYDYEDEIFGFCRENIEESTARGNVNRAMVSEAVVGNPQLLEELSNLISYHLDIKLMTWLAKLRYRTDKQLAVIDAPLLFQSHWHMMCHRTITVECDAETQRQRAMRRQGMTEEKLEFFLSRQLQSEERIAQADYVIDSTEPLAQVADSLDRLLENIVNET